jgi:ATP-dependent Zn protease
MVMRNGSFDPGRTAWLMRFGMSDRLGHLTYGAPQAAQCLRFPFVSEERNYSDKTSEAIDAEVRRISDNLYLRARTILTRRRTELERIAFCANAERNPRPSPDRSAACFFFKTGSRLD